MVVTRTKQHLLTAHHEALTPVVLNIHTTEIKKLIPEFKPLSQAKTFQFVILNMQHIQSLESPAWFREIRSALKQYNLILIGVREPQLNLEFCKALKIPVISSGTTAQKTKKSAPEQQNMYIEAPIRSGQQVYSEHGDLILGSSVNAGSEVAARDDIHVYGNAQGKLIAGVSGNTLARIYITAGFPELISIAGITLFADDLRPIRKTTVFKIVSGELVQQCL